MFERYTDRAKWVVTNAQETARELRHTEIEPVHLLYAIANEADRDVGGIGGRVLIDLGIGPGRIRAEIEEHLGIGDRAPAGHVPFTAAAKKVLELALRESLQRSTPYVATEHLLLALLRDADAFPARIVTLFGSSLSAVRANVEARMLAFAGTPKPPRGETHATLDVDTLRPVTPAVDEHGSCSGCKWWDPMLPPRPKGVSDGDLNLIDNDYHDDGFPRRGLCRVDAPSPVGWTKTRSGDWCGRYSPTQSVIRSSLSRAADAL